MLLWCKLFLVLSPRSWMVLVFLPRSWKFLQNLANLAKKTCQDLGKKCQKSMKNLRKTKTLSTGKSEQKDHWRRARLIDAENNFELDSVNEPNCRHRYFFHWSVSQQGWRAENEKKMILMSIQLEILCFKTGTFRI